MMSNYNFEATPTINGTTVEWRLCYTDPNPDICGDGTPTHPYPDVTLGKNDGEAHFKFAIKGETGIVFAADALWVHQKGQPNGPGVHSQIVKVAPAGTELTFKDKNDRPNFFHPSPITLKYQLNFVDAQGKAVTPLDPDIKNGGKTFLFASNLIEVGIGTLLAIVIIVALWRKMKDGGPAGAGRNPAR